MAHKFLQLNKRMVYLLFGRRQNLLVPFICWVQLLFCSESSKIWTELCSKSAHNIGRIRCSDVEGSFLTFMIRKKLRWTPNSARVLSEFWPSQLIGKSTKAAWFDLALLDRILIEINQKWHGWPSLFVRQELLKNSDDILSADVGKIDYLFIIW